MICGGERMRMDRTTWPRINFCVAIWLTRSPTSRSSQKRSGKVVDKVFHRAQTNEIMCWYQLSRDQSVETNAESIRMRRNRWSEFQLSNENLSSHEYKLNLRSLEMISFNKRWTSTTVIRWSSCSWRHVKTSSLTTFNQMASVCTGIAGLVLWESFRVPFFMSPNARTSEQTLQKIKAWCDGVCWLAKQSQK